MPGETTKQNPSILVTGGGGFLGKAIIQRLLQEGFKNITSFSRGDYPELGQWNVARIQGNLSSSADVDRACRGMDLVFHTAAKAGVWGPREEYFQTNVLGTQNVVEACKKHHVGRLIFTSSASVVFQGKDVEGGNEALSYPETYLTHYPETKALAEQCVVKAASPDLLTLVLRPHLIWGPGDNHLVPRILDRAESLRQVGSGKNIADTIFIDNAAHAHVLAARKLLENPSLSGKIYFISQDDKVPVWDMINAILAAGGKPIVTKKIPAPLAYALGALLEGVYTVFKIRSEPKMTRFVARELSTSHWYDISAAKHDLGYHPEVSTSRGLSKLSDWLKTDDVKGV
jgi:nucleoside-diphosphate-sugar epimerase